jgi:hypothetical protein
MKYSNCIFKGLRDDDVREIKIIDVAEILGCGCAQAAGCTSKMSF